MSKIEWTGKTWNPVTGCDKVSPGCDNCYALTMSHRLAAMPGSAEKYAGTTRKVGHKTAWTGKINLSEKDLTYPLTIKKPTTFFVNSMSDLFHVGVPFEYIDRVFAIMALTPQHTYQILTKRPERMAEYFKPHPNALLDRWVSLAKSMNLYAHYRNNPAASTQNAFFFTIRAAGIPLPNVWLGTSVEDQKRADERIPHLLSCRAAVRFLSCEPLLGSLDLTDYIDPCHVCKPIEYFGCKEGCPKSSPIHWVIAGGESGPNARPMHPDWVRALRDQCEEADVAFFFKQWGEYQDGSNVETLSEKGKHILMFTDGRVGDYYHPIDWANSQKMSVDEWTIDEWNRLKPTVMSKLGKAKSGSLLDGVSHKNFPKK